VPTEAAVVGIVTQMGCESRWIGLALVVAGLACAVAAGCSDASEPGPDAEPAIPAEVAAPAAVDAWLKTPRGRSLMEGTFATMGPEIALGSGFEATAGDFSPAPQPPGAVGGPTAGSVGLTVIRNGAPVDGLGAQVRRDEDGNWTVVAVSSPLEMGDGCAVPWAE
jgi:hypothetical protein